jgi:ABC-type sulfate/molybdate transport systems ATPase subunit
MILVTHDMRMARDLSDHVVFLHQGLVEEEGPPDQLFGAPEIRPPAAVPQPATRRPPDLTNDQQGVTP